MEPNESVSACPGIYHLVQAGDGGICRIRLEQGRITAAQLRLLAKLSQTHGNGTIEITSRANIQLRGIMPDQMSSLVDALEYAALAPKIPQGDGVRNVMINPTAGFDPQGDDRMISLAQDISNHLQTNPRTRTLSPKFSIFLDGGEACAVTNHINDIWLSLCDGGKNFAFGLASRPPLATDSHQSTVTALAKIPFAEATKLVFTLIDLLLDWRNHQPEIKRMKHLTAQHSPATMIALLKQKLPLITGAETFHRAVPKADAHLGIHPTRQSPLCYLGIKPPLGRLTPTQANLVADVALAAKPDHSIRLTPWQSLILPNWQRDDAGQQMRIFRQTGFITDHRQALAQIVCCTGAPGCASAKGSVMADAQILAKRLEGKHFHPIHLSGCAKSCAASEARATTLVAVADGLYDLFTADLQAPSPFGRLISHRITLEQFLKTKEDKEQII